MCLWHHHEYSQFKRELLFVSMDQLRMSWFTSRGSKECTAVCTHLVYHGGVMSVTWIVCRVSPLRIALFTLQQIFVGQLSGRNHYWVRAVGWLWIQIVVSDIALYFYGSVGPTVSFINHLCFINMYTDVCFIPLYISTLMGCHQSCCGVRC